MADKVYAKLKVAGEITVVVHGDETIDYDKVLSDLMLTIEALDASDDCIVEVLSDDLSINEVTITDAK